VGISRFAMLAMALWASGAMAEYAFNPPDWVEAKAPAPPAFTADHVIAIDMPPYVTLDVGMDPATVSVGTDGVVRYVVVMRNASGSTTAAYEGIRCTTDEVKTYARTNSAGEWVSIAAPRWRSITDNLPSKHAFAIARQGACNTRLSSSVDETLKALRQNQKLVR
jgi:hypothetical protein